jgi:uncharacterized membrane protein YsdA (DUF1294 family)
MNLSTERGLLVAWAALGSLGAFLLFGFDKWRSRRRGARVSEATLLWTCVCAGWPGGLLGILVFRHKSAKTSFRLKFAAAFLGWAGLVAVVLKLERVF